MAVASWHLLLMPRVIAIGKATGHAGADARIRTVVRTRDDIVEMRVPATNQLAALLDADWPGARAIFADIESPIALEFRPRNLPITSRYRSGA
jgi:hypothetical protein